MWETDLCLEGWEKPGPDKESLQGQLSS